jgi:hypothetical protein
MPITDNNQTVTLTASLTSATTSDEVFLGIGGFTAKVKGGVGTVKLQRYDLAQAEWDDVYTWTAGTTDSVQNGTEQVGGAKYRFNATAYTSGTIKATLVFLK